MSEQGEKLLLRIRPPWMDAKFEEYIEAVTWEMNQAAWTTQDLRCLCIHFQCPIDELVEKVARDKFGKG